MKLKCSFEAVNMGNEIVAVPVGDSANQVHGILKLNESGLEIIKLLEEETNTEKIIDTLTKKYDNDVDALYKDVSDIIDVLRCNGLIIE